MLQEIPVPILIVSKDVPVTSQSIKNGETSRSIEQNFNSNHILQNSLYKFDDSFYLEKKFSINSDAKIEDFEDFMEICITYKCKECSFVSNDKSEFHQHCFKHLFKKDLSKQTTESSIAYIYLCSTCNKAFNSIGETKEHMIEEHNLKNDMCENDTVPGAIKTLNISIETNREAKIKKEFHKKKRKLNDIVQSLDPSGNITLSYFCKKKNCKYKFRNEKDVGIHEKCHIDSELGNSSKRLYQCFKCNELFSGWHTCCSHLFKAHEIECDLLQCPLCESYRTSLPLRLENHIRIHSDVRAFPCKHCGKTFKQASQLRNHVVTHIDKNGGQKPYWSRSKQCNICFKMYSDSKSLKKHKEEVHSKLRPFVCSICGHASARKAMLLMHQRQHTGHKPYLCQLCNFKTADHNSLRKHMMRHTGVRPYKCSHCNYSAIQSGSFKNHMKIVHPNKEGMYICSLCQYKTVSEDNYVRHVSDHLTGVIKCNTDSEEKIKNIMQSSDSSNYFNEAAAVKNIKLLILQRKFKMDKIPFNFSVFKV